MSGTIPSSWGGAHRAALKNVDAWYNNIRDDEYIPGAKEYFANYMKEHFVGWSSETGNVDQVWSGGRLSISFPYDKSIFFTDSTTVLGYSADLLPYVGEHPEKPGIFVLAGFTG